MYSGAPAFSNEVAFDLHVATAFSGAPAYSNMVTFDLHVQEVSAGSPVKTFFNGIMSRWFRMTRSFF